MAAGRTVPLSGIFFDRVHALNGQVCSSPPPALPLCLSQAFLVAVLYTAIGVLRLGWIIRFIGHPVIAGFTSGAALTIAAGQVGTLLSLFTAAFHVRR